MHTYLSILKRFQCSVTTDSVIVYGLRLKHELLSHRLPENYIDSLSVGQLSDIMDVRLEERYLKINKIYSIIVGMWPNQKRKTIPRIFVELIAILAHLTQVCLIYYYDKKRGKKKKKERKTNIMFYND